MVDYAVVGQGVPRLDAAEKATGRARYGADIHLPGMLCGKLLRSPHPHARIRHIDTSRAEALKGVRAVVTARDVRPGRYGNLIRDEEPMARDKVLWVGDRVAAVAADTEEIAEEALELIQVDYELLPAVLDPFEAMKPDAPILHEDLANYGAFAKSIRYGNVTGYWKLVKGDVERGFAECDGVVEERYTTVETNQSAIEPNALVASVDAGGKLTVWVSTQSCFRYQQQLAEILNWSQTKVRVIGTHVGGGFGGKGTAVGQAWCSLLAIKSGRPVRAVATREDDFSGGRPRHPATIDLKVGYTRAGRLLAGQARVVLDGGAIANLGPQIAGACAKLLFEPYQFEHILAEAYRVYTNKVGCAPMRAPGGPQASWAMEQALDTVAERLGIDPLDLRQRNAIHDYEESHTGQKFGRLGLRETLLQAGVVSDWGRRPAKLGNGTHRGRGIAAGMWHTGGGAAGCQVKVQQDGTIQVSAGSIDIGQGSTTILAQIVAEELGVRVEDISMVTADTDTTPFDSISAGSSVSFRMGNAAKRAAADAKQQLLRLASEKLEANADDLEARDRFIFVRGTPDRKVSVAELARAGYAGGDGPVLGRGSYFASFPPYDKSRMEGENNGSDIAPSFVCQAADVEVDAETGQVRVLSLASSQDVGKALNRMAVQGQIEGGALMGLGMALTEEVHVDDKGEIRNPNFLDYKLLTALDQPAMPLAIVEVPAEDGPFGARGVGEPPVMAVPAAVANAVYQAVGVRIKDLPITPGRIRAALRAKGDGS